MIQVRKRDGKVVPFNLEKIKTAILKDLKAIGHEGDIEATAKKYADEVPGKVVISTEYGSAYVRNLYQPETA